MAWDQMNFVLVPKTLYELGLTLQFKRALLGSHANPVGTLLITENLRFFTPMKSTKYATFNAIPNIQKIQRQHQQNSCSPIISGLQQKGTGKSIYIRSPSAI
jgi:hypothetical protein